MIPKIILVTLLITVTAAYVAEKSMSSFESAESDENDVVFDPRSLRVNPCEPPPPVIPPEEDISKLTLWELLEKTEKDMEEHTGDAILLLGNTGSGKSTVVQVVAGNLSALHVYETAGKELIIVDPEQTIGITTESRTLVPALAHDPVNNLYYFDCPGFSDNRGTNADITANYLLNKVTQNVASVRLVFIVIQSAVKVGNDKKNFDYLAASAVHLIKNLDKLESTMGMIITKAENFDSRGRPRSDQDIMDGIVEFLEMYKQDQEKQLNEGSSQIELIRRKIRFVEILLQKDRIWFFRQPDECGPLTDSTHTESSKNGMIKLMKSDLHPVDVKPEDFAFAVTDSTLVEIYSLYEQLNKNVTDDMTALVAKLRKAHFESTLTLREFDKTKDWIGLDYRNFTDCVQRLTNSSIPSHFGQVMADTIITRGYNQRWALEFKEQMEAIDGYMNFFDEVARENQTYPRNSNSWRMPLETWVKELSKRQEFFEFLNDLRRVLSSYRFQQKDKPSSRPQNIRDLKTLLGPDDGHIIKDSTIEIYEKKDGIVAEDIEMMWVLVKEAIEKPELECKGNILVVKGTFIKVTDFTKSDGSYAKECAGKAAAVVKVYATRNLFFNNDISPVKSIDVDHELALVAPGWEVITGPGKEQYLINLEGAPAPPASGWVMSNFIRQPESYDLHAEITQIPEYIESYCDDLGGVSNGNDGRNGKPGGSGLPGGNFLGIVADVDQGNRLTISVSGGAGSNGVAGQDGTGGQKGKTYPYKKWRNCDNSAPCAPDDCKGVGTCKAGRWNKYFDRCHRKVSEVVDCRAEGCLGGRGGNGGNGGASGFGGFVGNAELLEVGQGSTGCKIKNDTGRTGNAGQGGSGGRGGQRGDGTVAGIHQTLGCLCWWEDMEDITSNDESPRGRTGSTGTETNGQRPPRRPSFTLNHFEVVLGYKEFAIPKQSVYFPSDFIRLIENSPAVTKEHSPIRFSEELLVLEELILGMRNARVERESLALRFLPFYHSILDRIDTYTKTRGNELSDANRKLLSLLYSTIHNQIRTLKQIAGTPVIVDVSGYLDTVNARVEQYNDVNTAVMIRDEQARYKDTFLVKIEQAMVFLVDTVDPALDETYAEIDGITQELKVAIDKWIEAAEAQQEEYKKALEKAKQRKVMNDMFSILKIGGTALSILGGPIGAAAGGIIATGVSIGQNIAMDQGGSIRPPTPLPDSIKKYADQMEAKAKATSQERQDELDTLILESRSAVDDNPETLTVLKTHVDKLEKDKKELLEKGEKGTLKQFNDLDKSVQNSERELVSQLEKRVDHLEKAMKGEEGTPEEQEVAKKHGQKAIDNINHVNKCVKVVADLGFDVYKTHKNDKKEIARLAAMVEEAGEQVKDLEKYKEAVEGILVPFTDSVIQDMDAYAQELAQQSAVFIRVQRWKIEKTLREYNFFLQDFTEAFPSIAKQYAFQVENLQEAMTLMIDLYEIIEQYNEQMQFADYIANINSPRGRAAVLGPEAARIYDRIDLALHANLILIEWDRVIQTFQQWVFPFSEVFDPSLKTHDIPDYLAPEVKEVKDVYGTLIPEISKRVSNLKITLNSYKSAIFEPVDTELILTEFNSNKVSTVPFFTWSGQSNHVSRIRDLFLGTTVTFVASPKELFGLGLSAVKFTMAELEPKARNETFQAQLAENLKKLRVRLTHSGVSRYLFDDMETEMVGNNLTIQYNFERDSEGKRLGRNSVYDKLESGDMILSPYTLWTAQFVRAHPEVEIDFEEFAKLASAVDLELIGKGSFVRPKGTFSTKSVFKRLPLYALRQIEIVNLDLVDIFTEDI